MKAIGARIEQVLGLDLLEVEFGKVTVFEGKNGYGKTSSVEALQSVFTGQGLKSIKNIHADENEPARVVVTLQDDDDHGRRIIAERNEKGVEVQRQIYDPEIGLTAAYEKVKRPADYLANLLPDSSIVNPIKILNATGKDRASILLEALPIPFNEDDFWNAIGLRKADYRNAPTHKHALFQISLYRQAIFDRRTDINRDEKSARATCEKIRRKTPIEIPTVDGLDSKKQELIYLKSRHSELRTKAIETAIHCENTIRSDLAHDIALIDSKFNTFEEEVMREARERIEARRVEIESEKTRNRQLADEAISNVRGTRDREIEIADEILPEIEAVVAALGKLEEQLENVARIKQAHEMADGYEIDANQLRIESVKLTEALDRLDKYKSTLTEDLPIKGLDMSNGDFTVDGVPWHLVNMGRRIEIAVQIICLRFGDAKFKPVFIDGAESLDPDALEMLNQELIKQGAQAFISRVTGDKEMKIRKVG